MNTLRTAVRQQHCDFTETVRLTGTGNDPVIRSTVNNACGDVWTGSKKATAAFLSRNGRDEKITRIFGGGAFFRKG